MALKRDDAFVFGRGWRLSKLVNILKNAWHGDRHCYFDLVGVFAARMGW